MKDEAFKPNNVTVTVTRKSKKKKDKVETEVTDVVEKKRTVKGKEIDQDEETTKT